LGLRGQKPSFFLSFLLFRVSSHHVRRFRPRLPMPFPLPPLPCALRPHPASEDPIPHASTRGGFTIKLLFVVDRGSRRRLFVPAILSFPLSQRAPETVFPGETSYRSFFLGHRRVRLFRLPATLFPPFFTLPEEAPSRASYTFFQRGLRPTPSSIPILKGSPLSFFADPSPGFTFSVEKTQTFDELEVSSPFLLFLRELSSLFF